MKRLLTVAAVLYATAGGAAFADCAAEIDALSGGGIAQDGSHAPLGTGADTATSPDDVAAQEEGKPPAAAATGGNARMAALDRARAAAASGDEAGCMAALEEARSM